MVKDMESLATGFSFMPGNYAAPAASLLHIARDIEGIIRNLTED